MSLTEGIPDRCLETILYFVSDAKDFRNCERTCQKLRRMLSNDAQWKYCKGVWRGAVKTNRDRAFIDICIRQIRHYQRNTKNCILSVLGVDGWKELVNEALQRFFPDSLKVNHGYILRGDTLAVLVEMVQDYLTDQLQRAHIVCLHRSKDLDVYPEMRHDDYLVLEILSTSSIVETRFLSVSGGTSLNRSNMISVLSTLLDQSKRVKIVRKLAFRAGIVKLTNEVFDHVWKRMVQLVVLLLWPACTELVEMPRRKVEVDASDIRRVPPPSFTGPEAD